MKKLLLNVNYITAVSNIASVVSPNFNHNNIETNQQISDFIKTIATEDFIELNKISEQIADKKISATKLSKKISKEDLTKIVKKLIGKTDLKNQLTQEQKDIVIAAISDSHLKRFQKEVKKIALEFKKDVKKNKELSKKFKKSLKTRIIDQEKKYQVNIIDGEENSKQLIFELEELKKLIKINKKINDDLLQELKTSENLLNKLISAQIGLTVSSIISGIASLFFPFLTTLTFATGISSGVISVIIEKTNRKIEQIREKITYYTKLFSIPNEDEKFSLFKTVYGFLSFAIFGIKKNLYDLVSKATSGNSFKVISPSSLKLKPSLISNFNVPFELIGMGFTIYDLLQSNQRIAKINEFEEKLHSLSVSLWSRYNVIEEVEWVVINETPQTDYYYNSGTGGKNLVFKNLKTNETKTIEQMLEIDPLRLRKWGMIKVFNPFLNEWYIRKLPNSTKIDNLG
ncbi:Uncharacterised protein [Mesomycoplasma dispar]|uniref:Uncharacterized protein n=1 Tax=Mesomycoplasma dispar TaxID=86660 RepID=A0AAJ5TCT8_9BACT|nr:hypothetical protein [Mesomycoplasma dispar]AJR12534.1 hypothetical protein MDIS_01530 [Mesomycoplasma dispar]VEU61508.1 Uncharacterised protein [Mesomycoplasma dispar]